MGSIRAILETKWQSRYIFEAAASRGSKRVMVLTEVLIHKLIVNLMGSKWVESVTSILGRNVRRVTPVYY